MDTYTLEELLGQRTVFQKITENINKDEIILIRGETGYGKSYLLEKIKQYYSTTDPNGTSFVLENNIHSYDYAPFLTAISQNENLYLKTGVNVAKSFTEMIPVLGKSLDKAFTLKRCYPAEFTDVEVNIISQIRELAHLSNIMLFCDDICSWDEPSLILLIKLIKYRDKIGICSKIKCICTDSTPTNVYDTLFTHIYKLKPFNINNSVKIVKIIFPDTKLDDESIKRICSICNCNIGVIKLIISNINSSNSLSDKEVRNIIVSKLQEKEKVSILLDKASIIGISSNKTLLHNYTKYDSFDFQYSLGVASDACLIRNTIENIDFTDECIWSIFNNYNKDNKKYHYELAECIKAIMPSCHKRIGSEYILAGLEEKASIHFVLSAIHYYITHRIKLLFTEQEKEMMIRYNLFEFCNQIIELYENYFNGVFKENSSYLLTKYDELNFEIDYYQAFISANMSIDQTYYENVNSRLQSWVDNSTFQAENPEQWLRAALLCLETEVELHKGLNKHLLIEVQNTIQKYFKTDKTFEVLKYDFDSKSNSIFSIDIAANVTFEAVNAYERSTSFNCHSYKYIVFLTNALANSIVIGRQEKAFEYAQKAINCITGIDSFPHNFIGVLSNNFYLALLLWKSEHFFAEFPSISKYMKKLIEQDQDEISKVLYKNNLAVFYLYCKEFNVAESIFEDLYRVIEFNDSIDDYYSYIIKNNYCLLQYVKTGKIDVESFAEDLSALKPLDLNMKYFNARNKYMKEKLSQGFKFDFDNAQWNDFDSVQVGDAWFFWGKWFLMSDIQFWSE